MKSLKQITLLFAMGFALAGVSLRAQDADVEAIKSIGPEGKGHAQAVAAAARLGQQSPDRLIDILKAMDGASPLALNWFRAIAADIADNGTVPAEKLKAFVEDRSQNRDARFVGFLLLAKDNRGMANKLLEGMRDDPNLNLRYAAIDQLLKRAKAQEGEEATETYQQALATALHPNQLTTIAKALREADKKVDLAAHMGFLKNWKLIAPFDNTDVKGYAIAHPPESEYLKDSKADLIGRSYQGKPTSEGKPADLNWSDFASEDELGLVNLNPVFSNEKSAVCYAYTTLESSQAQPAQLRLGCINANKIWVNGELVMQNEVYHARTNVDQYIDNFELKKGTNTILVKVCQNDQSESWAQRWQFQLRITDPDANPIAFDK